MNTLKQAVARWSDTLEGHKNMNQDMVAIVNQDPQLKEYRDFIENHIYGFGERSFLLLWSLLITEMPEEFTFCEIGVFKGQILALIELLANRQKKKAHRVGITPLSNIGVGWESDYGADIEALHAKFGIDNNYDIIKKNSTDEQAINMICDWSAEFDQGLDLLYIDGGHDYETALSDIKNYCPLVKPGGYAVIDDCCNDMQIPFGMFPGITEVTRATKEYFDNNPDYEFIMSVVHIKVYKKK